VSRKPLQEYRAKRDFTRTAEPSGDHRADDRTASPSAEEGIGGRFVVQRHRARRLHYDLRLEMGGVLVSWAVPRGPTLDPSARHLAVHVEDHPLEYADFEGVIPAGEYGGGDVIVWDRGRWAPTGDEEDPLAAVAGGELHFDLFGEKLAGRFVLVRTDGRNRRRTGGRQDEWLLLHKRDDHAVDGWDPEAHPRSVKSGRTNDEVAAAPEAMWRSDAPASEAEVPVGWPPVPDVVPVTEDELAALDNLPKSGRWVVQGRELQLTNLDKVLFPAGELSSGEQCPPVTKRDLIRYVVTAAPAILPYLANRPVNLRRHPDGVTRKGFWQKAVPPHAPDWWRRWRNDAADPGETEWYSLVEEPAALAWLANAGVVELHPWTSTAAAPNEPTWAQFDLDPGETTSFDDLLVLARLHRSALEHLGVQGCPKVSGRRGIQILVPVGRGYGFEDTRRWVEQVSRAVGATVPELVSWEWHKGERGGLARLDYTQNAINRTLVSAFSPRAAAGAPVSVPVGWEELDDSAVRPDGWSISTVTERVRTHGDPLRPLVGLSQRLPALG
jgi:bifunctional non-homologous end joining protein LigD